MAFLQEGLPLHGKGGEPLLCDAYPELVAQELSPKPSAQDF